MSVPKKNPKKTNTYTLTAYQAVCQIL